MRPLSSFPVGLWHLVSPLRVPPWANNAKRHGDEVSIVGINLDSAEDLSAEELRQWVVTREMEGLQVHDGECWDSPLVKQFGVREIPFTVVVGPDGSVLAVNEHGKGLEKAVKAAAKAD